MKQAMMLQFIHDNTKVYNAVVKKIFPEHDLILLQSDEEINETGPYLCDTVTPGQKLLLCGYGNEYGPEKIANQIGCLHSVSEVTLEGWY